MSIESINPDSILLEKEAMRKARETHLQNLEEAMAAGDNEMAHRYFYNLAAHLEKYKRIYGFTDEETGINLKEIAKKVALFYLKCAKRVSGKAGANDNIKWLNEALKEGELTCNDIGVSAEEIESLRPKS